MTTKKKNKFLTFCFSFMPGAGEMYMGFMKMGCSLMLLFLLAITFATWISQSVVTALCIVPWFYSFFHANHLASLSDEEFAKVKDEYFGGMEDFPGVKNFVGKYNKWIAYILIFTGLSFLWNTMGRLLRRILPEQFDFIWRSMLMIGDYVPSILIGLAIIVLGIRMLSGKKVEIVTEEKQAEDTQEEK